MQGGLVLAWLGAILGGGCQIKHQSPQEQIIGISNISPSFASILLLFFLLPDTSRPLGHTPVILASFSFYMSASKTENIIYGSVFLIHIHHTFLASLSKLLEWEEGRGTLGHDPKIKD